MSVDIDKILKENRERVRIQQYEDTYGGDWSDYVPADKAGEIYYNNIGVQNAYTTKNSGNAYLTKKADDSKPKSINIQTSSQDVLQQNEINQKNDLDSDETAASKELGKVEGSNTTVNVGRPINNQSNPLHFYPSYNYIITLSCASRERINTGQGREIVIFKSGGKGKQGDGPLSVDYYVDNLVIRNTVSPTTVAGTGTAYQIAFEVTEPFGVSFIDALIKASRDLGYQNHLKAVFLLKVEFKGFDDAGEPSGDIPFSTREIPIHLYQADMSVQAGVTVYDVQAIPASYLALTALHQTTLETIRCSGETVGDVLLSFFEEYNKTLQKNVQSKKLDQLDNFELSVEDSMADILKSPIGYDAKSSSSNKIMFSNGEAPPPVQSFRGVTIAKGTGIQTFIEAVIRESEFYRKQFDQDGKPLDKDNFLFINRLFSRLEVKTLDNGNNRPSYTFFFIVRSQKVSSSYFDKEARDLTSRVSPLRTYNYLYTGQNQDVIDFNISYKFGFYQAISHFQDNDGSKSDTDGYNGEGSDFSDEATAKGVGKTDIDNASKEIESQDGSNLFTDIVKENGELATIFEKLIMDPTADLINVDMEIIGDPLWIEQKSVNNLPFAGTFTDTPGIDSVGAVAPDEHEVYVKVNFKTPTDLDDQSGLFNIGQAAFFQGIYKVFLCENRFAGGVYTNILSMVRMRHQDTSVRDIEPANEAIADTSKSNSNEAFTQTDNVQLRESN